MKSFESKTEDEAKRKILKISEYRNKHYENLKWEIMVLEDQLTSLRETITEIEKRKAVMSKNKELFENEAVALENKLQKEVTEYNTMQMLKLMADSKGEEAINALTAYETFHFEVKISNVKALDKSNKISFSKSRGYGGCRLHVEAEYSEAEDGKAWLGLYLMVN